MNINIGAVANVPPFSSLHVQRVEGGFVCLIPPGAPVVSKDSGGVATAAHIFLGQEDVSKESSAEKTRKIPKFGWPEATVPQGAVFCASKVGRVRDGRLQPHGGFILTFHTTLQNSACQVVAFNRATVMDQLKVWITIKPPQEPVQDERALLTLTGMRINPDMRINDEAVFVGTVLHSSQIKEMTGGAPFVLRCEDPHMAVGIADEEVVGYLAEELGRDLKGNFAVRVHEAFLEFGPRVEEE